MRAQLLAAQMTQINGAIACHGVCCSLFFLAYPNYTPCVHTVFLCIDQESLTRSIRTSRGLRAKGSLQSSAKSRPFQTQPKCATLAHLSHVIVTSRGRRMQNQDMYVMNSHSKTDMSTNTTAETQQHSAYKPGNVIGSTVVLVRCLFNILCSNAVSEQPRRQLGCRSKMDEWPTCTCQASNRLG